MFKAAHYRWVAMPVSHPTITTAGNQLFARFARFESALKRAGFYCLDGNAKANGDQPIKPDWNKFKKCDAVHQVWSQLRSAKQVRVLFDNPPRTKVLRLGSVQLGDPPPRPANVEALIDMILRIRNNLFHGDKQAVGLERDEKLMKACLAALEILISAHPHVQGEYEQA